VDVKQATETPAHRAAVLRSLDESTTLLENMFWAFVLGYPNASDQYFDELVITDLVGPGHLPDDAPGEP
jgi:hypothetical protein